MKYIILGLFLAVSSSFAINIDDGTHYDAKKRVKKTCVVDKELDKSTCTYLNFRGIVESVEEYQYSTKKLNGKFLSYQTWYVKSLQNCEPDPEKTNGYDYKCEDRKLLKESGYYYKDKKSGEWIYYNRFGKEIKKINYGDDYLKLNIQQEESKPEESKERYAPVVQYNKV